MFVGSQTWDPWMIMAQIVTLQCIFYFSLCGIQLILVAPYRRGLSIDYMFDWHHVRISAFVDNMVAISFILNSLVCAVALRFVVARAKKCLDFGSTMYIIHLLWCWSYTSFPLGYIWWAVLATCLAITVLVGEYLCVQLEMTDIPISSSTLSSTSCTITLL